MSANLSSPMDDVIGYVHDRGLIAAGQTSTATELVGGVSGEVVRVDSPGSSIVVKRALAQLHVQATWLAKPERALTEAAALQVCNRLTPQHTPQVLDIDADTLTFTMTAAPANWPTWKEILLGGGVEGGGVLADEVLATARTLGVVLATWHRATFSDPAIAARFNDYEAFSQLRVNPFHRATAAVHPEVADALLACGQELLDQRECLVHGDYSPKNVLVGSQVWVLDFEVAHFGAAVFDVAFLQSHLMLKALHLPARAALYAEAGLAMMDSYLRDTHEAIDLSRVGVHIASLMLARVDGMSPASYLGPDTANQVRQLALDVLTEGDIFLPALWQRVTSSARRGTVASPSQQ